MTKNYKFLKKATMLLLSFLAVPFGMLGQTEVTYTFSENYSSNTVLDGVNIAIDDVITAQFNKRDGGTATQYYTNGSAVRWYGGGTLEISSSNATISEIVVTFTQTANTISTNVGDYSSGTWTGEASSVTFTQSGTSGHCRISSIKVTYTTSGGSALEDNDLALTGAPVALTFDLYDNAAQTINFTTSSTGAVTVATNDYVDGTVSGNTISVTPKKVTNGVKTITVNQAATDTYKAGSATFTVEITDSTPFTGGDVTFVAGTDLGSTTTNADGDEISKSGVTVSSTCAAFATAEYRLYQNSTTTISTANGTITNIQFTKAGNYNLSDLSTTTGSYNSSNGSWTGDVTSVSFSASKQVRLSQIVVTVTIPDEDDPSIEAENVEIAYNAESGAIEYTINNPVDGGELTASTQNDWLTIGTVGETVPFTCSANNAVAERTATVTLTYTYGEESVTKNVTVTQAGNPNVVNNISDITSTGNYTVQGTVVAISNRGFVLGDGTGYVYYYVGDSFTPANYNIGDMLKLSGAVTTYGGAYQFGSNTTITTSTTSNYVTEDPTVITGAQMDTRVASTTPAQLASYVQYEGKLTVNGTYYNITDIEGATTAQGSISYPLNTDFTSLDGKQVIVKGYYVGISTSTYYNTMLGSIEEVLNPVLAVTPAETNLPSAATTETLTVTATNFSLEDVTESGFAIFDANWEYILTPSENPDDYPFWLTLTYNDGQGTVSYSVTANESTEARTAYFKLRLTYNSQDIYSDQITITQAAAPAVAHCYYSVNGVVGTEQEATVGTLVTLETGEDLDANFTFAGWTTDPNNVETLYTQYTFNANDVVTFYAVYAHTNSGATQSEASYVKVTNTANIEDGNYLIVYEGEESNVAFDGGLETLDATGNSIAVEITNGQIASSTEVMAAAFTIAAKDGGYSIKSASGLYIGNTSDGNNLKTSSNDDYTNIISIDNDGNANIVSSGSYLRYNSASNQLRFRYYKSTSYTGQKAIQLYKYTEPTQDYYTRVFLDETVADNITIVGPSIIPSGQTLDMSNYTLTNNTTANLIIEDGGQLKISNAVKGTMQKNITGYGESAKASYYLVASPFDAQVSNINNFRPETADMAEVDWYEFDESAELEWVNKKYPSNDNPPIYQFDGQTGLSRGKGYLYARKNDVVLGFAASYLYHSNGGNPIPEDEYLLPTNETYTVSTEDLSITEGAEFEGWNLVGNPFTCDAYINRTFFRMNQTGSEIVEGSGTIKPGEGVFVVVTDDNKEVKFTTSNPPVFGAKLAINLNENNSLMDRAVVNFTESQNITKFVFNENTPKLYIPQGGKDYAVVHSNGQGEMPVNFKAAENGTYTLSIDAENVEMDYMHLIDNMTGADVDLLQTPSYTFEARTSDYASRFRLVFSANNVNENAENDTFAYFNGSEWVINGSDNATVQVIDMMGRVVLSGTNTIATNDMQAGVYVIRLVDGNNVKTQKIVVQ